MYMLWPEIVYQMHSFLLLRNEHLELPSVVVMAAASSFISISFPPGNLKLEMRGIEPRVICVSSQVLDC